MPQLLNALSFLHLIPLFLKSYLFHMHKPLSIIPLLPPSPTPLQCQTFIYSRIYLLSINSPCPSVLHQKINKQINNFEKSKAWSLSVFFTIGMNTLYSFTWSPFSIIPFQLFFALPILPKPAKSRLCSQAPKIYSSRNSSV